ncbi:MAG: hypothetical protein AABX14_02700 [Candidatus Aenigmatarchaeota archaeon]
MRSKKIISAPVLLKVLAALIVLALPAYAIPTLIDFQGKLTDNNNNAQAGTFNMTFIIYTQASGGAILWQENKLVTVSGGIFSTLLGSVNPINTSFGQNSFLEIVTSGETLSPRYQIGSVPYAFRANVSELALASSTTTPSFIIKSITSQTSNLTEWHDASGNVIAYVDTAGNLNVINSNVTAKFFAGNGSMLTDVIHTGGDNSFSSANVTNLFITNNLTILKNLSIGTTLFFADQTLGRINITGDVYIVKRQTGRSNGTIILGYSDSGGENITFDETKGSHGKFVFSAPLQIAASSPGITFYDITDATNLSRQASIVYNYSNTTNPISFTSGVEVNGSLSILGSSPAFISFGRTGSASQQLSFDPSSQQFSFSGGTIAQDFSNLVKNGGFESFSGATGTFSGGSYGGIAPDGWTLETATSTIYWYAPSNYTIGTDIYQGYNSLKLNPPGKITQTLYSYQLQPNKTYSIGVWVNAGAGTTARLNITGTGLLSSFTIQQSAVSGWRQLKGQFSTKATLTTSDVIKVELDATGTSTAYFDSVQLNTGGVLGEYQDAPITQTGDQTIYGGLRLQRTGYGRGGTLTVDQAIRTKQIEFSYNADPGYGGIDPRYMSDPRYNWTGTYASSNVVMELWGNYALRMKGGSGSTGVNEFAFLFDNPAGPTISTSYGKTMIFQGTSGGGMTVLNITNGTSSGSGSFAVYLGTLAGDNAAGVSIGTGKSHPLAFFTNGVDRMRITSDGKVGIGKTNPSTALDVQGTISATSFIGDGSQLSGVSTNANVSSVGSTGYVPFFGNATQLNNSVIYQNGTNIGIGTTSPQTKLDVAGGANITGDLLVSNVSILTRQSSDNTTLSSRISTQETKQSADNTTTANTYAKTSGAAFTGDVTVGGGLAAGGITLQTSGNIWANGSLYILGNITNVNVTTLNVNGTIRPAFDATFDLGTSGNRFANAYVSNDVSIAGVQIKARQSSDNTTLGSRIGTQETKQSADNTTVSARVTTNTNDISTLTTKQSADNTTLSSRIGTQETKQSADNTTTGNRVGTLETKQSADNTTILALLGIKVNLTQLSSYETTSAHASDNATIANTYATSASPSFTGTVTVGGGFGSGGITMTNTGDMWINGTLYVTENITNVNITNLNINGTLRPSLHDTFDIGATNNQWRDLQLSRNASMFGLNVDSGTLFVNGNTDRVGVGTTSPAAKLEIAGSAKMTSSGTSLRVTDGGDVIITLG